MGSLSGPSKDYPELEFFELALQYLISFKEAHLLVKVEEKGSRRVLYWDTLSTVAVESDRAVLLFFKQILTRFSKNLELLSFQNIEILPPDVPLVIPLLAKTGRVLYNRAPLFCDWQNPATVTWQGDERGNFSAFLQYRSEEIPFKACEKLFPTWCIYNGKAFPIQSPLSWKWLSLFLDGPRELDGVQKKRFLEESPPIRWQKSRAIPRLQLTDVTGCFANLEGMEWEGDLLEAGYTRKTVGHSHYFCPSDKTGEVLELLLDVGWEIWLADGRRLYRQTKIELNLREENGVILARGKISFQEKHSAFRSVFNEFQPGRLWIEIDQKSAGLLDRKKRTMFSGEWVGEALHIRRERALQLIPFLDAPEVEWEKPLFELVRGLKEGGERQTISLGPKFHGTLLPHQQKGLDWLWFLYCQGFSGLLADEMGLGKTVQVLAFFSSLQTHLPILIVVPASLLYHWQAEIRQFLPEASVTLFDGSEFPKGQFVIASYARLRIDGERLSQISWEAIVLDESNAIKTASTHTAQAAYRLRARFRIALSGTPMENRAEELESQFRFLMPGLIQNGQTDIKRFKPFILRRKKDELDLPEKMEQISWLEMGPEQRAFYDSYVQSIKMGLLKKIRADGVALHRMDILEAILRLRQICVDPRLVGDERKGVKIERLLSDIEEALGEKRKILIYSQFTSMLALIGKELRDPFLYLDGSVPSKERAARVRSFQEDSKVSLFLLSLKAGGVGLNLTAADYVLIFDPWWNEAVENQAIDRAHRIGQKKTVIAKRYIVSSTIEEKILQLKADKSSAIEALLDRGGEFNWTEEDLLRLLS